jgi:hypothetical protein
MTTESSIKNELDPIEIIRRKVNKVSFLKSLNLANLSSNNILKENFEVSSRKDEEKYKGNVLEKSESVILKIPKKLELKFKYADFCNFVRKTE